MKKYILLLCLPMMFQSCDVVNTATALSTGDVSNGLKAALNLGVDAAANKLTNPATYGGNVLVNNLLPPTAIKVMNTARQLGFGSYVDQVTNKMNTAAINTVKASVPIFKQSINQMTFSDAWGILRGGSGAGTAYLKKTASPMLNSAISAQVKQTFNELGLKTNLLQNFGVASNPLLTALDIDLTQPLTNLVSNEIFRSIETQENHIRSDISARSTLLLQRVFAAQSI